MNSKELLIFVGYGDDAREEALTVKEWEPLLRAQLKHLNRVATVERSNYSDVTIFTWGSDADVVVGGQRYAINPHLLRAAIAIFIFKNKIGPMTWAELESCRNRVRPDQIPTFVLFPATPPAQGMNDDDAVVFAWGELLKHKRQLTADWAAQNSLSVTPLPCYRDKADLKEIVLPKVTELLPTLLVSQKHGPVVSEPAHHEPEPGRDFLDSDAHLAEYDPAAVRQYRSLLRDQARESYPPEQTSDEFLSKAGYLRARGLTRAGVLLFSERPSRHLSSAVVQCSVYDGTARAAPRRRSDCRGPLLTQILDARAFIASHIRKLEIPSEASMQATTIYQYPMICVREVLANAVCHRDYTDTARMTYVSLYHDRLEIRSPGIWTSRSLDVETAYALRDLVGHSVQRNMRLAEAISAVGMMEVEGSGIPSAVADCASCGAPEPEVELRDGYVCVTVYPRTDWEAAETRDNRELREMAVLMETVVTQTSPRPASRKKPEAPKAGKAKVRRGDVVIVELRQFDRMSSLRGGRWPCVVVQNDVGNQYSPNVIVAPIADLVPGSTLFEINVELPPEGWLERASYVDCRQLHTVPLDWVSRVIGKIEPATLAKIDHALKTSLSL